MVVLDDPPRVRVPLILLGLAIAGIGIWLTLLARKKGQAA